MQKNVTGQYVSLLATDSIGNPTTGVGPSLLFYVSKDNGAPAVLTTNSGVPTEDSSSHAPGVYTGALTQSETNADKLNFSGVSSISGVFVVPWLDVATDPPNFNAAVISSAGTVNANMVQSDSATFHNQDGTLAGADSTALTVTFPANDI